MRNDQQTATQHSSSQRVVPPSTPGMWLAVKLAALALAALAVMGVAVPAAQAAGSVPVSLCRTADGQAITAPGLLFSADDPPGLSADIFADSCAQGGSIELSFGAGSAHRGGLSWALFTPANRNTPATNFYNVRLWRSITSDATSTGKSVTISGSIQTGQAAANAGESCVSPLQQGSARECNYGTEATPLSDANKLELRDGSEGTGRLSGGISCYASADFSACPATSAPRVRLRVYRISLRAPDPTAPSLTSATGALLSANATVKGTQTVTYSAGDTGYAGVWKGELLIDGQPAATKVADENAGLCRQLSDGSFGSAAPCKPTVDGATVALDTATVANGTHQVALRVSDAAGNTTVSPAATVTVANPPANRARPVLSATGTGFLGAPKVGDTLASTLGSWTPEGVALVRQWVRCDVQANDCRAIAGAVGEQYKLTAADVGQRVRLRVDASNSVGSSSAQSDATAIIAGDLDGDGMPGTCRDARLKLRFGAGPRTTVRFGRTATLRGTLRCATTGQPIGNASIALTAREFGKTAFTPAGVIRSDADGRFSRVLAAGPGRALALSYTALAGDALPAATASAVMRVRGKVTLRRVRGRVRSNGGSIAFRGRVHGGRVPAGFRVLLQAQDGRRWRVVEEITVKPNGSFRLRYRCRCQQRGALYRFRVRIPQATRLPYLPAHSRAYRVRVR